MFNSLMAIILLLMNRMVQDLTDRLPPFIRTTSKSQSTTTPEADFHTPCALHVNK
jgi:hypothetical protein